MSTLHQYIAVIGCLQGCLLFGLLITDSRVTSASKILGFFCLLIGLSFLLPFITTRVEPNAFSWLAGWMFFFPVSYGPLLYLYCRNAILGKPLEMVDLVHFVPLLSCYLLNIDTLLYASEEIRGWIVGRYPHTWRLWLSEYLIFAFAFFYAGATVVVIRRFQRKAGNTLSSFNPAIFRWLWTLVLSIYVVWVAKAVMAFTAIATPVMIVVSDALIVILIYLIALAQWRTPKLFTIDQLSDPAITSNDESSSSQSEPKGALDAETRAKFFESVKQQVEEQALYRDSELSLASLAAATGLGIHHLSEVLNQHEGKNFNQFINAYRIADVCERLKAGASSNVLDIALEAGFSSKSTFNTMFKKFTGSTPTQYRKNLGLS